MKKIRIIAFLLLLVNVSYGQKAIEDNSFLIEEAYNQEKGVVQFINTFYRTRNGDWAYSFTNEIPVKSRRHQFSYTVPIVRVSNVTRVSDTLLNYRYQIKGMEEDEKVAVAPRISIILPTGNYRNATGTGATGVQVNLPVSVKNSKRIVTHWNAGATVTPRARNPLGQRATTKGFNLGQSTVWLARTNFNVLFETSWNSNERVVGNNRKQTDYSLLLNPGIRWAWNFTNGLQIVPGLSAPIGVGPSYRERGFFLYLSFER